MSDQYTPPRPIGTTPGTIPGTPRDEYTRTSVNVGVPPSRPVDSGSGFGTGMLVAGVFVVIAILAYVVLGDRFGSTPTPDTAPSVAIENNNAPAAAPAPAPTIVPDSAPAEPAPAPAPDTGTADPVVPAPDAVPPVPANP
ncbi:MAG: hypothetical protein EAZ40_17475 [Rhodobacterales bacterium]|nr:MAG: hypothetical protein EAZ40_17475 [Rhodobacterales bacterium]